MIFSRDLLLEQPTNLHPSMGNQLILDHKPPSKNHSNQSMDS